MLDERIVLVATDLGDSADEALRQGDEWAAARRMGLVACFILPEKVREESLFPPAYADDAVALLELERRASQLVTERICRLTKRRHGDFKVIIDGGRVDLGIVRVAAEEGAAIIVVGQRRSSDVDRLLLGSISERIVRYADCSVLVSRAHRRTGQVLAATDLSDGALPAVAEAADTAARLGHSLTILHCVEPALSGADGDLGPEMPMGWTQAIASQLKDLTVARGVNAIFEIAHGSPAESIVARADSLGAELIVLGTRGRSGISRVAFGSVAETVARSASCSVLAVRLGQPTFPAS